MGYINECNSQLIFQANQFTLHFLAKLQIQSPKWLIQKENLGFIHNRSCNRHTLLLTTA